MSDDTVSILLILFWAMAAFAVYQRVFVIRRLQKKLDRFVDEALARSAPVAPPAGPAIDQPSEMRRVQERLRVLERIAVEKEDSLSREIADLRSADA